jgi:hypothetical protein
VVWDILPKLQFHTKKYKQYIPFKHCSPHHMLFYPTPYFVSSPLRKPEVKNFEILVMVVWMVHAGKNE